MKNTLQSISTIKAAKILDISARHIRRLIASGEIRAFKISRVFRIKISELELFMNKDSH